MERNERACRGEPTLPINDGAGEFEECLACGKRIAWDFVDHPFFGFQTCEQAEKDDAK